MADNVTNFKVYTRNPGGVYEYARGSVNGNVAYDLNRLPREEQEAQPEVRTPAKVRTYTVEKSNQGLSAFAIVGFAVFAALMVLTLLARVQLTQISDASVRVEREIHELREQENRLKIEYESAFNLTEIEEYATKKLGMVKAEPETITMLESTTVDRAEVLAKADTVGGMFAEFKDFITSLLAYL